MYLEAGSSVRINSTWDEGSSGLLPRQPLRAWGSQ
jgi:hypothetical protein